MGGRGVGGGGYNTIAKTDTLIQAWWAVHGGPSVECPREGGGGGRYGTPLPLIPLTPLRYVRAAQESTGTATGNGVCGKGPAGRGCDARPWSWRATPWGWFPGSPPPPPPKKTLIFSRAMTCK